MSDKPPTLRTNVAANMAGRAAGIASTLVFLPFYLDFLGPEAYGVIGVYATVLGILAVSDLGLAASMNRETARLSLEEDPNPIRDTVRTLESAYLVVAASLAVLVVLAAPKVAVDWVRTEQLDVGTVTTSVRLMGAAAVFQLVSTLYVGGMLGLQRQVRANVIMITMAALRGGGSVLILWLVDRSLEGFFVWQVLVNLIEVLWLRTAVQRSLPGSSRNPRFSWRALRRIWRYAAGMAGMSITGAILLQTDKVVLSRALSLEAFGFYSIAWIVAVTPSNALGGSIHKAVFPRMTQYVETAASESLRSLYHLACQLTAIAVIPSGIVIALFGHEVLVLWLGSGPAADTIFPSLVPLAIAMTINGLMIVPYALQLAHGWTNLAVTANVIAVILFVPLVVRLAEAYGAPGGGIAWIILTVANLLLVVGVMHRFILKGESRAWSVHDVLHPLVGAAVPAFLAKALLPELQGRLTLLAVLLAVWLVSCLGALLTTRGSREWALSRYRRSRERAA